MQETKSVRARCQPGAGQRIKRIPQERGEPSRTDTRSSAVQFYTFIRNELQRPPFPRCSGLTVVPFDSCPKIETGGGRWMLTEARGHRQTRRYATWTRRGDTSPSDIGDGESTSTVKTDRGKTRGCTSLCATNDASRWMERARWNLNQPVNNLS